jgi:hypothetical protein
VKCAPLAAVLVCAVGCAASPDCTSDPVTSFVNQALNPSCWKTPQPAADEGEDGTHPVACLAVAGEPACEACVRAHCCALVLEFAACAGDCGAEEQAADACQMTSCAKDCPE